MNFPGKYCTKMNDGVFKVKSINIFSTIEYYPEKLHFFQLYVIIYRNFVVKIRFSMINVLDV